MTLDLRKRFIDLAAATSLDGGAKFAAWQGDSASGEAVTVDRDLLVAYLTALLAPSFAARLALAGGTMTGPLILSADPTDPLGAATKQFVTNAIAALVNSSPATLDTLKELADALGDDANFAATMTAALAGKLALAGGTMTGALMLAADPVSALQAVTKQYQDNAFAARIDFPPSLLINGGMRVDQEHGGAGVTLTGTGATQTKYLIDMVMAAYRGTFVAIGQRVTDAPPGFTNSLKISIPTAQTSLGANDELTIVMPIEGARCALLALGTASVLNIAVVFWVKAHRAGTYSGALKNGNVGGAIPRSYPFSFTVSAADTWEYKTVSVPGDVAGSWATGNTAGLYLAITMAAGSSRVGAAAAWAGSDYSGVTGTLNAVAATSDVLQVTGAWLAPGTAVPSQALSSAAARPFGEAQAECRRYYNKSYDADTAPGTATANGIVSGVPGAAIWYASVRLDPPMRAAPTPVVYSPGTGASGNVYDFTASADKAASVGGGGERGFIVQVTGLTAGDVIRAHWIADARL